MIGAVRAYKTAKTVNNVRAHHLHEEEINNINRFLLVESRHLFFIIDHNRRPHPQQLSKEGISDRLKSSDIDVGIDR